MSRPVIAIGVAVAPCLFWPPAVAGDASQSLYQLHHTAWTTHDGAPGDIESLAQTPDGMLWVGSGTGLFRFDGVTFERFVPGPGEASLREDISTLHTAPNGDLWIGTRFGEAHVLSHGRLRSFGVADGLPKRTLWTFAFGPDGRTWASNVAGVFLLDGDQWIAQDIQPNAAFADIAFDREGTLWAASTAGTFCLRRGATVFARASSPPSFHVRIDARGSAWATHAGYATGLTEGGMKLRTPRLLGPQARSSEITLFDGAGMAWLVRSGGLSRLSVAGLTSPDAAKNGRVDPQASLDRGMSGSDVEVAIEDREGTVWLGTNAGLDRFRSNKLTRADVGGVPLDDAALAPSLEDGVWAGTMSYGLVKVGAAEKMMHILDDAGASIGVMSIHLDPAGALWVGGVSQLLRSSHGRFDHVPMPFDGPPAVIQAVTTDALGDTWISVASKGVWKLHRDHWIRADGVAGLPEGAPLCITAAADGALWFGYLDGRLALLDRGQVRLFGIADGVTIGNVLTIHPNGRNVWFGGSDGVMFYRDGRFHSLKADDTEALIGVSGIVASRDGDLWFNGASAIARLSAAEIDALASNPARSASIEVMNASDGRDGPAEQLRPLNTAIRTADGRLWFATTQNVYWIDPTRVYRNPVAPSVFILAVNDGTNRRQATDGLVLPKGTTNVDLTYTATSLRMPERVRFRYRLEGVDKTWQDAGVRRRTWYTNLRPGAYRFDVIACNEDGVWNTTGATLSFSIAAAFYQTLWFQALCVLAALAGAKALARRRLGQVSARLRLQLEARSLERERIARDLHDTMLQGTQGLVLSFQVLADKLPARDALRQSMETILDHADEVIAQTRDSVLSLRTAASTDRDLPLRLQEVVDDMNAEGLVVATLTVSGTVAVLSDDCREEVFRIAREALLNAFRHARAAHIAAELSYAPRVFELRIRDDGAGMDGETLAAGARPGHWGLVGMRERAARIGATLALESDRTRGTLVTLVVPGARAYSAGVASTAWQRLVTFFRRRLRIDYPERDTPTPPARH